jgi:hypothetical protein
MYAFRELHTEPERREYLDSFCAQLARRSGGALELTIPTSRIERCTGVVGVFNRAGEMVAGCAWIARRDPGLHAEQFMGEAVDLRSAVALWEAIYGRRPFTGRSVVELAAAVCAVERRADDPHVAHRAARVVGDRAGEMVPERLRRALARGLALRPDERYSTLDPLIDALSTDPTADPSAARGAHRLFLGIFATGMMVGPILFGVVFRGSFELRKTVFFGSALFGCLLILTTAFAFRRTLLRNAYHRRMLLFLGVLAVVAGSQRVIAVARGLPLEVIVVDALHITTASFLVGAVFSARWMIWPGLLAGATIVAALALPSLFPGAILVVAPSIMVCFGYFWNREASRGGHR